MKETTAKLLDHILEPTEKTAETYKHWFLGDVVNGRTITSTWLRINPAWSRGDIVFRALGVSMCDRTVVERIIKHNRTWSFSGLLNNIPPHVKITVLASDPELGGVCHLEHVPCDVARLNAKVFIGTGHWIQYKRPNAIMDEILPPRAKL